MYIVCTHDPVMPYAFALFQTVAEAEAYIKETGLVGAFVCEL